MGKKGIYKQLDVTKIFSKRGGGGPPTPPPPPPGIRPRSDKIVHITMVTNKYIIHIRKKYYI